MAEEIPKPGKAPPGGNAPGPVDATAETIDQTPRSLPDRGVDPMAETLDGQSSKDMYEGSDRLADAETVDVRQEGRGRQGSTMPEIFANADDRPAVPKKIGNYTIKRVLGTGGMGTVYEAEQENPRRTVALKVMKQGIVSRATLRRFAFEAEFLGRLRHPGIAQVYEAGTHDDGTGSVPYFVMEFVPNAKELTQYSRALNLSPTDRLKLFVKVCEAVQHGHTKGVIHRDLKPANVLVDQSGQPKIIDFGVARTTDSDVSAASMHTEVGQLVGTVQYMSPEQCDADPNELDTRSDVYSLGVVLYELLSDHQPYELRGMTVYQATKIIHDQAPERLSRFDGQLKGDVETIALKALEKDRNRRYQSAAEFAADIERYLKNEPILARAPSVLYQMKMYAKRNTAAVIGMAAVAVVLVAGVIGISVALAEATWENARAMATIKSYRDLFSVVDSRESGLKQKNITLKDWLVLADKYVDEALADYPETRTEMLTSISHALKELGYYDEAEPSVRSAVEMWRSLDPGPNEQYAQALEDLGAVCWFRGFFSEAIAVFRESLVMRIKLFGEQHEKVAHTKRYLAAALDSDQQFAEAEKLHREALDTYLSLPGIDQLVVARTINGLATCLRRQGRLEEAVDSYEEMLAIYERQDKEDQDDYSRGQSNLAKAYSDWSVELRNTEKFEKAEEIGRRAEELYLRAIKAKEESLEANHPDIAISLHFLAQHLKANGKLQEALPYAERALAIRKERLRRGHSRQRQSYFLVAEIDQNLLNLSAAEMHWWELLDILTDAHGASSDTEAGAEQSQEETATDIAYVKGRLGEVLTLQGQYAEAEKLLIASFEFFEDPPAGASEDEERRRQHMRNVSTARQRLHDLYVAWEKPEEAAKYAKSP